MSNDTKTKSLLDKWNTIGAANKDDKLSTIDPAVLFELMEHTDKIGETFIGSGAIAAILGKHEDTIKDSFSRLRAAGYFSYTGRYHKRAKIKLIHLKQADTKHAKHSDFWSVYPKKEHVSAANRILACIQGTNPSEYEKVIDGARRYAVAVKDREPKFIKQPDNWLKKESWLDDFSIKPPRSKPKNTTTRAKPKNETSKTEQADSKELVISFIKRGGGLAYDRQLRELLVKNGLSETRAKKDISIMVDAGYIHKHPTTMNIRMCGKWEYTEA